MMRFNYFTVFAIAILIAASAAIAGVRIVPKEVGLVVGAQQQFKLICEDEDGNEIPVPGPVQWSTQKLAGMIDNNGLFTALNRPGKCVNEISASGPGFSVSANVEVYPNVARGGYVIERSIGGSAFGSKLTEPIDITSGPGESVYVLTRDNMIHVFDASGNSLLDFKLTDPISSIGIIGVDGSSNVYVLDCDNCRISKYDSSGAFVTKWETAPSTAGPSVLVDMAVDSAGRVYICDQANYVIHEYGSDGTLLQAWEPPVNGWSYAYNILAIEIDSGGNMWVMSWDWDTYENTVQVYNPSRSLIADYRYWGHWIYNASMSRDNRNHIYVVDDNTVYEFACVSYDDYGELVCLNSWGGFGHGDGEFDGLSRIAFVGASNTIYTADTNNNRVGEFTSAGEFITSWSSVGTGEGQFNNPSNIAVDSLGNVYVGDAGNYRVQVFNSDYAYIRDVASKSHNDPAFACAGGLAIGPSNSLYVSDTLVSRLLAFDSSGALTATLNFFLPPPNPADPPPPPDADAIPMGIAYSPSGFLYVNDAKNSVIRKMNTSGETLAIWSGAGNTNGKLNKPVGIGVDSRGYIYVADSGNNRIQIFNIGGGYYGKWGAAGSSIGQFQTPTGLCIDSLDHVVVADTNNNRIQRFSSGGGYLSQLGIAGCGAYEFSCPEGVAVDRQGKLYVADTGNHRIVKYTPVGTVSSIKDMKAVADSCPVQMNAAIVSAAFPDTFYIENKDRTCGIRVDKTAHEMTAGKTVNISGVIKINADGEHYVLAGSVSPVGKDSVRPIAMANYAIGGSDWPFIAGQQGVAGGTGPNNIGLLVCVFGKVTYTTSGYFYVDDGSGLSDGSDYTGVKVLFKGTAPEKNEYVQVTGVVSCFGTADGLQRLIRATAWRE